jgi:hypothetical protein
MWLNNLTIKKKNSTGQGRSGPAGEDLLLTPWLERGYGSN